MTFDHGELNVPLDKRGRSLDAQIDDWKRDERRKARERQRADRAARVAAREAEGARVKFTAADLADASHVRDKWGWYEVAKVNAKTVAVLVSLGGTYSRDRIPLDRITQYAINGKPVTTT